MSNDMFTSNAIKFHYEVCFDYVYHDCCNDYIAIRSNWDCNAPDDYELVQAGPQPAGEKLCASAWDIECPF